MAAEVAALAHGERATYERFRVQPEVVQRVFKGKSGDPVPSFVIARSGSQVLFYDDIEEEWGTARLTPDGRIRDWGTWGERLSHALRNFPAPEGCDRESVAMSTEA